MYQNRFYDEHTLYLECGVANEQQIIDSVKTVIAQAEKLLNRRLNRSFNVNVVMGKNGEYLGYCYLRLASTEIYWMLLGRNHDGTERFEERIEFSQKKNENFQADKNEKFEVDKTWYERTLEEDAKIQQIIKRQLPPLLSLPGYKYEDDQINHLKKISVSPIPEMGYFIVSRGYATDAPPGATRHRLCARNLPKWVTEKMLKDVFVSYVSDSKKIGITYFERQEISDTYPIIHIINNYKNSQNTVFVSFDPSTKDAIFALLMTKKIILNNDTRSAGSSSCCVHFTHSYEN